MTSRPLRADAQRNRDRLLSVAVRAFSQSGPDVPLESIAREAGVGIGTLYRHFPSREALVEAAYRNELERLCDAAAELLAELPADQALRAWMRRYVAYAATKRGMMDALRMVIASGADPFEHSRSRLTEAVCALLTAGAEQGSVRRDAVPDDVLKGVMGMCLAAGEPANDEQANRLLDLLMNGLRYGA